MKRPLSVRSQTWLIRILLIALILWGIVYFVPAPLALQAQGELRQENVWTRVTPSVAWCDDPESTVAIEAHIVNRFDIRSVQVTNGSSEEPIELYDDGTNGDAQAGDMVFTASNIMLHCDPVAMKYNRSVARWLGFLRATTTSGAVLENNYGVIAALVDSRFKDTFEVIDYGDGLSATAYAFFIEDSEHQVIDNYPVATVFCGTTNFEAYRKLYSALPDAYDFALVMPGMQIFRPDGFAENVPYMVHVKNEYQNIGVPIMDDSARFGSGGRLKSAIYHSFGSIQIFDHEVAHTWGADIGAPYGILEDSNRTTHWNSLSDIGGQLGAYYFTPNGQVGHFSYNGDETWRFIPNYENEPYAPLELYVMGLISAEEVPPIHILHNPNISDPERVITSSYQIVTLGDIMQLEGGPRVPYVEDSQKDFNLAFIATQDQPYNDAAYAYFSLLALALMSKDPPEQFDNYAPFYWATGGRATLDARLPVDLPDPDLD